MVVYEWARSNGGFIAYAVDPYFKKKMVAYGKSHQALCHNFAVLLKRAGLTDKLDCRRYLQAEAANPALIEKFGYRKRGGFVDNNIEIETAQEIRVKREASNEKLREEFAKFCQNKQNETTTPVSETTEVDEAPTLSAQKAEVLKDTYESFSTKTLEDGTVMVYGLKLLQTFTPAKKQNA